MVSLLSSQDMNVVVLLDGEASARRTAEEDLVKAKLIRERDVLFATDAFENGERKEADVEDLLDAEVYRALVREAYEGDLDMAQLDLNPNIPRIVRRYERAFEKVRMPFHKTRPARLFLNKMASEPDQMLTVESRRLFSRLFDQIRERREQQASLEKGPFR